MTDDDVLGFIAFHTCEQYVCVRAAVAAGIRIIYKFFLFRSAFDIELYSWPAQSDSHSSDDNFWFHNYHTALEIQVDSAALCAQGDSDYSTDTGFGSVRLQREEV